MNIYIVEGHTGQWSDAYQFNVQAFYKKEDAEKLVNHFEKFIPPFHCSIEIERACKYELAQMGLMYSWKEDDHEDVPYFTISYVYLEEK